MTAVTLNDPALATVRRRLGEMYGDRLVRAVVFGSRARGDHLTDSDYDVAVFLDIRPDWWRELDRLAAMSNELLDEIGTVFDVKPYAIQEWWDRTPLMGEIRREGVEF